jgi:hypothetical protein
MRMSLMAILRERNDQLPNIFYILSRRSSQVFLFWEFYVRGTPRYSMEACLVVTIGYMLGDTKFVEGC